VWGRRLSDVTQDLRDQFIDKIKTSRSALQIDKAIIVVKDAHIIA